MYIQFWEERSFFWPLLIHDWDRLIINVDWSTIYFYILLCTYTMELSNRANEWLGRECDWVRNGQGHHLGRGSGGHAPPKFGAGYLNCNWSRGSCPPKNSSHWKLLYIRPSSHLDLWPSGLLAIWGFGLLGLWSSGALDFWPSGLLLAFWSFVASGLVNVDRTYSGTLYQVHYPPIRYPAITHPFTLKMSRMSRSGLFCAKCPVNYNDSSTYFFGSDSKLTDKNQHSRRRLVGPLEPVPYWHKLFPLRSPCVALVIDLQKIKGFCWETAAKCRKNIATFHKLG